MHTGSSEPPPLPPPSESRGRVVGSTVRFGPGFQSFVIGCILVGTECGFALFWMRGPDGLKIVAMMMGALIIPACYLLIVPTSIWGAVRATTAFRLRIETTWAAAGMILNLLAIAGWLTPILLLLGRF
jgi:hypothetical protein